jgi:hypothetical protein
MHVIVFETEIAAWVTVVDGTTCCSALCVCFSDPASMAVRQCRAKKARSQTIREEDSGAAVLASSPTNIYPSRKDACALLLETARKSDIKFSIKS